MIVLLGEFNGKSKVMPYLAKNSWGRMWASYGPTWSYDDEPWGFDNGAWSCYVKGRPFDVAKFKRRLATALERSVYPPVVAVVPDVVGNGLATLAEAVKWRDELPSEWPWFLAVQDGCCVERVRRELFHWEGIFLGGTDAFKRTAGLWCELAHRHDKPFHFARCNREAWIRNAIDIGADSIDTTRPVKEYSYGTQKGRSWFRRFEQLVTGNDRQQRLAI